MGNRLSGLLAEVFMDRFESETFVKLSIQAPSYRYVDDLLIFTKGEDEADLINREFNNNQYGLKFKMEKPVEYEIPYLDFTVKVSEEGVPVFNFFRKPTRKDIFVNANTALPKHAINSVIEAEWDRISKRCSENSKLEQHGKEYKRRLLRNGHGRNIIVKISYNMGRRRTRNNDDHTFYLNIPFVNEETEFKIKKALRTLGLKIHISHKNTKLRHALNENDRNEKCNLTNCRLNNDLCLIKGAVYRIKCTKCEATYIGSSWRPLHTRYREHMNQRASVVNVHLVRCGGRLAVEILEKDTNIQRMRIKEAILIKKEKPILNAKEDLFKKHILFD